jgi:hypothetical protein
MARPVAPLVDPAAVHNTLARLGEGEMVPREVYIADYADGDIPRWVLIWRKEIGSSHFALVFEDQTYENQPPLEAPSRPRRGVLTSPCKSLCTQVYLSLPGELPWPAVNRLADLVRASTHRCEEEPKPCLKNP